MTIAQRLMISVLALVLVASIGCKSEQKTSGSTEAPIKMVPPTAAQLEQLDYAENVSATGNYDEALSLFQDLLSENPTIAPAYVGIGDIHVARNDYEKAEPAYARAARLEPSNFDAQYGHGLSLQMLGRFVPAIAAYRRALGIDPGSVKANRNVATTYLQLAQPEQAVLYAERAVEIAPDNGPARANLGAVYEELGRSAEAIDTYIVAIELMGNEPPLMLNLINVLADENRYREAANTAATLVRVEPSANAYERLGWCSFKLRDYEESKEAYFQAIEIDPDHWPSHNGIAVNALNEWLLSKRRDEEARFEAGDHFRLSLRVNPSQPRVVQVMLNYQL